MSKIGDKIYVGNDVYTAHEDICGDCCGCIADHNDALCSQITRRVGCLHVIWIKQQPVETQTTTCNQTKGESEMNTDETVKNTTEEPKYTLAEFIEAYNVWCNMTGRYDEMESVIKEYLEHKQLEYQEFLRIEKRYLELKQKFN